MQTYIHIIPGDQLRILRVPRDEPEHVLKVCGGGHFINTTPAATTTWQHASTFIIMARGLKKKGINWKQGFGWMTGYYM